MGEIITICNQKGGVGKTTTAVNLAACLAAAEKKTLLIDIDAQGNATTGVGIDKATLDGTIYDVLIDDHDFSSVLKSTSLEYLKVIPANHDLAGAEVELVGVIGRETRLKDRLQPILSEFDFVIIDSPPSLGLLTLNALSAASSVLIPVQCEYYAMEGIANLYRTIELVRDRINPDLKVRGIVLTMYDKRNNLSLQVSENIRSYFKEKVFQVIIPRNVKLSEAPSHGRPIILYDVNSKGALAYFELTQEILNRRSDAE